MPVHARACSTYNVAHLKQLLAFFPPAIHSYTSASLTFLLPASEKLANLFTDATKERKTERERPERGTAIETGRKAHREGGVCPGKG